MIKAYYLDGTNHISATCDTQFAQEADTFDFPADFNFAEQKYYKIVDGQLIEDTAKREEEEEKRRESEREAGRLEAQVLFTALMTDTLLEGE